MKYLILFFLFFISIAYVSADTIFSGQDHVVYIVDNCVGNIDIKIEASRHIDKDEYSISNCTKENNVTWKCPCKNPFNIILETKINTVNTYDFLISYNIPEAVQSSSSSSSGSGRSYQTLSGGYMRVKKNKTEEINVTIPEEEPEGPSSGGSGGPINIPAEVDVSVDVEQEEEPGEGMWNKNAIEWTMAFFMVVAMFYIYGYIMSRLERRRQQKEKDERVGRERKPKIINRS